MEDSNSFFRSGLYLFFFWNKYNSIIILKFIVCNSTNERGVQWSGGGPKWFQREGGFVSSPDLWNCSKVGKKCMKKEAVFWAWYYSKPSKKIIIKEKKTKSTIYKTREQHLYQQHNFCWGPSTLIQSWSRENIRDLERPTGGTYFVDYVLYLRYIISFWGPSTYLTRD